MGHSWRDRRTESNSAPTSPGEPTPPTKKIKTRTEIDPDAWASWKYPPKFWERLSKIWLTHRAVEEHNRRTRLRRRPPSPPSPGLRELAQHPVPTVTTNARDFFRFARHGGPDLSDLRGYPHLTTDRQPSGGMDSSSRSRKTKPTDLASTLPTWPTTKTKKSTPYDRNFDLHLTDHRVHPVYSSQEPDLEEIMAAAALPRPSLSPSDFSDGAFKTFRESNARAKDEDDVLANVIPTILGPYQATHASARNTVFGNLEKLTDGTIVPAKPDIYYGAYLEELSRSVRDELGHHIIPSTMQDKPIAPNFFVEVKGPDGGSGVATRQARYDGALGSRTMHSLQNYGEEEPVYDGNAYTFSSVYHDGHLHLYAHHPTALTMPDRQPEYHMTPLMAFSMVNNRERFVEGTTAFRNIRDLAKRHRDSFIQVANTKASQAETAAGQEVPIQAYKDNPNVSDSTGHIDYLASQNAK